MSAAALEVDGLCVRLGDSSVLRGIDLRVERGRTVALLGHNGAGKTTTLRAIMGLVPAAAGTVTVLDTALGRRPAHWRARLGVGYSPEERRMITALTVADNLWLPVRACGLSEDQGARRLEWVMSLLPELEPLQRQWAANLSGGQQKIVALGRALMVGRALLLLDEPFQGLAPALARRYAAALAQLRERDHEIAILVSESNPALLADLAERRYTIERGEIVGVD